MKEGLNIGADHRVTRKAKDRSLNGHAAFREIPRNLVLSEKTERTTDLNS